MAGRPDFEAFVPEPYGEGKTKWHRVGVAWRNKAGGLSWFQACRGSPQPG